jgi:hypothetical protein
MDIRRVNVERYIIKAEISTTDLAHDITMLNAVFKDRINLTTETVEPTWEDIYDGYVRDEECKY